MSTADAFHNITDRWQLLGAIDPDTDEIKPLNLTDLIKGLVVAQYVWDTNTLEWVKMQQPTIETGDLYLAMDEVEDKLDTVNSNLDAIEVQIGEVQEDPTANTVLARLKGIKEEIEHTLANYHLDDFDDSGNPIYLGYQDKDGNYYIKRINTSTGAVDYTGGGSGYDAAWANRASESYLDFAGLF